MVAQAMMREKRSYPEAARQFEVRGYKDIAKWERDYPAEGPAAQRRAHFPKIAGFGSGERDTKRKKP